MDWRRIPDKLFIGEPGHEELWSVQWRIIERAHGLTDFDARTIELDERLRHDPSMLATTWSHELLHASLRYAQLPRATEKVFTGKVEEDIVTAIAPVLSRAMAQLKEIK